MENYEEGRGFLRRFIISRLHLCISLSMWLSLCVVSCSPFASSSCKIEGKRKRCSHFRFRLRPWDTLVLSCEFQTSRKIDLNRSLYYHFNSLGDDPCKSFGLEFNLSESKPFRAIPKSIISESIRKSVLISFNDNRLKINPNQFELGLIWIELIRNIPTPDLFVLSRINFTPIYIEQDTK